MKIEPRLGARTETSWTRRINKKLFMFRVTKFENGVLWVVVDQWQDKSNCYRTRRISKFR